MHMKFTTTQKALKPHSFSTHWTKTNFRIYTELRLGKSYFLDNSKTQFLVLFLRLC